MSAYSGGMDALRMAALVDLHRLLVAFAWLCGSRLAAAGLRADCRSLRAVVADVGERRPHLAARGAPPRRALLASGADRRRARGRAAAASRVELALRRTAQRCAPAGEYRAVAQIRPGAICAHAR